MGPNSVSISQTQDPTFKTILLAQVDGIRAENRSVCSSVCTGMGKRDSGGDTESPWEGRRTTISCLVGCVGIPTKYFKAFPCSPPLLPRFFKQSVPSAFPKSFHPARVAVKVLPKGWGWGWGCYCSGCMEHAPRRCVFPRSPQWVRFFSWREWSWPAVLTVCSNWKNTSS